eukprot:41690-Ditylum_brightwellii.AAC.1
MSKQQFQPQITALEQFVDEMAEKENQDRAAIIRQIKNSENKRIMYRKVKQYLKQEDQGGLTQVNVPE